ncbi:NAD-dependent succinate-semialdehyde dehydrogenase [Corynebacterium sp. ES2794-CONJ1]|uniref:NAD-dependent succinate-semialdehyde dehydrogenase n=1 Tax=Corynebacterium sp. ES2794-CONJ1 TaxID=2980553 RepID=UPI003986FC68
MTVSQNIFIGHTQHDSTDTFTVINPATEEPIAEVANATSKHWMLALDKATEIAHSWGSSAPRDRSEILEKIHQAVSDQAEELAQLITMEMGKTLTEAKAEIAYGLDYFRWFHAAAERMSGYTLQAPRGNGDILVTKEPVGPVLAITPWNFPFAMAARKLAPALAAGCPVILKPADLTPLTMLKLAEIIGPILPDGVLSVIPTTRAKELSLELMADPRLKKLSFTGSTAVGTLLAKQAAPQLIRLSLELGGNAPFIVAADADMDKAIDGAIAAKMRNGGQACICANRFFIHSSRIEEFTTRLTERMNAYHMGPGTDPQTTLGPMVSAPQRDRIHALVQDALECGAEIISGGYIPDSPGYFYPPTVISGVDNDMKIAREEIFGPVAGIQSFDTNEEVVVAANNTHYGLAAYAYTESLEGARYFSTHLNTGMVGINRGAISDVAAPFGGVKLSGLGREGGLDGIEEFLNTKYIAL